MVMNARRWLAAGVFIGTKLRSALCANVTDMTDASEPLSVIL